MTPEERDLQLVLGVVRPDSGGAAEAVIRRLIRAAVAEEWAGCLDAAIDAHCDMPGSPTFDQVLDASEAAIRARGES